MPSLYRGRSQKDAKSFAEELATKACHRWITGYTIHVRVLGWNTPVPLVLFVFMGELEYNQIQELQIQAWWWNLFEHFDLSCRMVPFFWYDCEKGFCKCAVFYGMSWYPCLFHSISMYVCFFPCNLIWVGWLRLESLTILRRERESTSFWAWDSLPYEVCLGQVPIAGKRVQFQGVTRQNQLIFAHGRWSHQKRNPCWRLIRFFPVGLRGGLWSCNGTRGLDLYIYTVVILTMYIYIFSTS